MTYRNKQRVNASQFPGQGLPDGWFMVTQVYDKLSMLELMCEKTGKKYGVIVI